ncbi:hypothetical protein MXB_1542 [Myxobolus squamalis]|nr:hypothetical protein MXB_1542 [Myxobolus squamalis]
MRIPSLTSISFFLFKLVVGDPSANLAGFWDPVTSLVDWCEENYIKNYFIGEFCFFSMINYLGNTLSNLAYLFLFLYALFFSKIRDVHTKIFTVSILFINRLCTFSCDPELRLPSDILKLI